MALDYTATTIASGVGTTDDFNNNFTNIETAMQDGLSRSGNTPNSMSADIDMNSNKVTNLADGSNNQDAATYGQVLSMIGSGSHSITVATTTFDAQSSDPADPGTGSAVMWLSDGTGSGSDGDIMLKITDSSGTTKTTTLVTFSAI